MREPDYFATLQPQDRIFSEEGPESEVAEIGTHGPGDYLLSYKDAADRLVSQVIDDGIDPDLLFMPIAFLYRHWIELSLKSLLLQAGRTPDPKHGLVALYTTLTACLVPMRPGSNPSAEASDLMMERMKEWEEHDKNSTSFRYYASKKGDRSLTKLARVNIIEMSKTMEKMQNEFHGYSGYFSAADSG